MIDTTDEVLAILKRDPSKAKHCEMIKSIIERNIPVEGYQINMQYLNRGWGKTWMSYVEMGARMLYELKEKEEFVVEHIGDPDCTTHNRRQTWLKEYQGFVDKYFSDDVELLKYKSSGNKLVYKRKDSNESKK